MTRRHLLFLIIFSLTSTSAYCGENWSMLRSVDDWNIVKRSVELPKPKTVTIDPFQTKDGRIVRLPGPTYYGPDPGCGMCLGNHLMGSHGISYNYLRNMGYYSWLDLHSNLHNAPKLKRQLEKPKTTKVQKTTTPSVCYSCG